MKLIKMKISSILWSNKLSIIVNLKINSIPKVNIRNNQWNNVKIKNHFLTKKISINKISKIKYQILTKITRISKTN